MEKVEYYCNMCGEKLEKEPKSYYNLVIVRNSNEEIHTVSKAYRIDICGKCEPKFLKFLTGEKV